MTSCEWCVLINTLAITIAKDKSSEDLTFLCLLFNQLADTLAVLAVPPPNCT